MAFDQVLRHSGLCHIVLETFSFVPPLDWLGSCWSSDSVPCLSAGAQRPQVAVPYKACRPAQPTNPDGSSRPNFAHCRRPDRCVRESGNATKRVAVLYPLL